MANAMMGEVTAPMAAAVTSSPAKKDIDPSHPGKVAEFVGVSSEPLPHLVNQVAQILMEMH